VDFEDRKAQGLEHARSAARKLIRWHLGRDGKRVFCEKSLPNADHAFMLAEMFPRAKFVCLYRHPLDFIASATGSSKWGFSSYGILPYASASVNNFVLAPGTHVV
jgi:protein-tyrosine sulfotransferase